MYHISICLWISILFSLNHQNPAIPFARSLIYSDNIEITDTFVDTYKNDIYLTKALQIVAIEEDCLDNWRSEVIISNWFTTQLIEDIITIRHSYDEVRDCPKLEELYTFGFGNKTAQYNLDLNRGFDSTLHKMYNLFPTHNTLFEAYYWNKHLYHIWSNIHEATSTNYSSKQRRMALRKLKELIGEEDFKNRNFPPPYPVWTFSEILP